MSRQIKISSIRGTLTFGDESGIKALIAVRGTGLPPVDTQWFDGVADGSSYRAARVLPRVLDLPIKIVGENRERVLERYSLFSRIIAPEAGLVRLTISLAGIEYYLDVVRTGGGDFSFESDTDGSTFLKTVLTFQAGDPYWTSVDASTMSIGLSGLGRGLLKTTSLSKLRVSSSAALGTVTFENNGDAHAYPTWTAYAPFNGFTLTSPEGQVLDWVGTKTSGYIQVDTKAGTVVDETGANQYAGLSAAPRFWLIPSGSQIGSVELAGATADSQVDVVWHERKWVAF